MKKKANMMKRCSEGMSVLRKQLKAQEIANKGVREQITAAWGDRTRDADLQTFHTELVAGKRTVRAYQAALHELKYARRMYNTAYDSMQRVLMEAVTPETEYVN